MIAGIADAMEPQEFPKTWREAHQREQALARGWYEPARKGP
jgi:hypothetical protein